MTSRLRPAPAVAEALASGRAVVALESSVIAQGLPWPDNLETARAMERAVAAAGAVPATVGLVGGQAVIGLSAAELETFARAGPSIAKASRRDLPVLAAKGESGATTVAGTMALAAAAGIAVMATGGIGGVHRGGAASLDISADLGELARTPVAVVASGAKSILDLSRTLEVLETIGVPVVGIGTRDFPAFYCRSSGLKLEASVGTPQEAATVIAAVRSLGLAGGLLFANPVPLEAALPEATVEAWLEEALAAAAAAGVTGKAVTPFLLARLHAASGGRTSVANRALLLGNARMAGEIAVALAAGA